MLSHALHRALPNQILDYCSQCSIIIFGFIPVQTVIPCSSQKRLHDLNPRAKEKASTGQAAFDCDDIVRMPNVTFNISGIGLDLMPEQYMLQVCPSSQRVTAAIQACKRCLKLPFLTDYSQQRQPTVLIGLPVLRGCHEP